MEFCLDFEILQYQYLQARNRFVDEAILYGVEYEAAEDYFDWVML